MSNKIKIQSVNGTTGKETVYVDVDDEITTIINKVEDAKGKIVALVLPKRAPVLQSIVNMKLLKRTADAADKNLVLVTGEAGLLPLAGAVGLHVASSPTSKPSIPNAPARPNDEPEDVDRPLEIVDGNDSAADDFDRAAAGGKTVGELARGRTGGKADDDDVDESIDMKDDADEDDAEDASGAAPLPVPKRNSKLRIPNFDSFRKKLALGVVGLALLVAGWVYAFMILPSAAITIHTDNSTVTTNLNLTLDTAAKALDASGNIVPATVQSQQKTASQQVNATGRQNNGEKATGSVTITNCTNDSSEVVLAAGRSITAGGHTYILNKSVDIPYVVKSGNNCVSTGISSVTVSITALKGGEDYNVASGTKFSVSTTGADGFSSSEVRITGSASGGTDDVITVVQQSDIDSAASKIATTDTDSVKRQLIAGLQAKGLLPVPTTFLAGTPEVTSTAKAGDAASNVTVTAVTTYTMMGVQKADLRQLVVASVNTHIDKNKQVILDDGITSADFTQDNPATPLGVNVVMRTKSEAGPQLATDKLKTQLVGKKAGDVKSLIGQTPGVTSVDVKFSPLWVSTVPKNTDKITIAIDKKAGG